MNDSKCPLCDGPTEIKVEDYKQGPFKVTSVRITTCLKCDFIWLPIEEEKRIDKELRKQRYAKSIS